MSDCGAPITLRFVAESPPSAIRTGDVAPRPAASPPGWTIEWDKPSAIDATINEYAATGRIKEGCPAPGLFNVPLTIYGEDRAATPLALTIIRVAEPVLDIPATTTLAAERIWGAPDPLPLLFRETVAGAPDTRVSVLGGELKTVSGEGTGIMLEPGSGTVMVKAGETARVMLAASQAPPPGTYTAKLGVNGPAVKPGTTVDVTYKVRLASTYLLGLLALGIAFGLLINGYLAARAALAASLLGGLRAMQLLTRRAAPQRDPAVQQRLLAVANLLQSGIEQAGTPAEVTALVAEAEAQAKEIENKAAEAGAGLLQALAASRSLLRPSGQELDEMLAIRLARPIAALDELQRAAEGGDVEQTAARLQDYNRDLPTRLTPIVQGFLADARTELDALGPLPSGGELAGARDGLRGGIADVYERHDLALLVKAADDVARRLRAWMDLVAPAALAAIWRQAALVLAGSPALAQRLNFAAEQAEQLRRTARDPLARLGALGDLSKGVIAAMTEAAMADPEVSDALAQCDIVRAACHLAGEAPLEPLHAQAVLDGMPAPGRALSVTATGPAAVLRVKPLIPLGQDTMVVLRWMMSPPPQERIVWLCHPAEAATIQPLATGAIVQPKQAGFLTIILEVDKVRVAEARTYVGEVAEQVAYRAVQRDGRAAGTVIAVAGALLTMVAGYEILVPTWFGTAGDCFGAFMWGFFGQFGLDRVRELAKPRSAL